jgi:hypothetical protein
MVMVPKVTIKALIFAFVTRNPLSSPMAEPKTTAIMHAVKIPRDCKPIARAADKAITEPTDKSKSPEIRRNVIPKAIIPLIDVCRSTFEMFLTVKKLGLIKIVTTNIPRRINHTRCFANNLRKFIAEEPSFQ